MVTHSSVNAPTKAPTLEEWNAWHANRLASVVSPMGNLALIETRWEYNDEEISFEQALSDQPASVTVTTQTRTDFDGKIIQKGVRLWDSNSEAIRAFEGIEVYPFDPAWIFEARFTPHLERRPVPFEYVRETPETRNLAVPGEIHVTIDGVNYTLDAFDDDGTLLLVFADPTNKIDTYPAGRFLFVYTEEGDDRIFIDFNRAFVPPCGFSLAYNCPLPPPQNRLHTPILAGEKNPVFRDNFEIH